MSMFARALSSPVPWALWLFFWIAYGPIADIRGVATVPHLCRATLPVLLASPACAYFLCYRCVFARRLSPSRRAVRIALALANVGLVLAAGLFRILCTTGPIH